MSVPCELEQKTMPINWSMNFLDVFLFIFNLPWLRWKPNSLNQEKAVLIIDAIFLPTKLNWLDKDAFSDCLGQTFDEKSHEI